MRRIATALLCATLATPALAEHALSIEINAAQSTDSGCNLSFLVSNDLGQPLSSAIFETVFFDTQGQVFQLSLFDFGHLPAGKPRVRQFLMSNMQCGQIGQILFNGATSCEGEGLTPRACEDGLKLSTRTDVEVSG